MAKNQKEYRRSRIKMRVRKIVHGSAQRPRMTVFRSNTQIYVQLIDDINGKTLMASSSLEPEIKQTKATGVAQAKAVGTAIAKKALDAGITEVVFDRNGYLYHGRVKSLADSAREAGLKF